MLDILILEIPLPDDCIIRMQLNVVETRRVLNSEKISKEGSGFIYQDKNCRDYWEFRDGINGNIEVTYFETGNVDNQGLLYKGPIRNLIVK